MKRLFWGLLLLLAGIYFAIYFSLFPTSPIKLQGKVKAVGLGAPVEVKRDRWGIPVVKAENLHDLFFAQGFVHCQERFFQMDLFRRAARGTLAEIFGKKALPLDEKTRKLGISRFRWNPTAEEMEILRAYAHGVNACLDSFPPSFEYKILRAKRERWEPRDSLYVVRLLQWSLAGNFAEELVRLKILSARPELKKIWPLLDPLSSPRAPYVVPEGQPWLKEVPVEEFTPLILRGMSNNWVISPERTREGRPILANDPHLGVSLPGIWYMMELKGGDYHVWGVSLPGSPGIVIGRNERIAWGFTNSFADVQDLYLVKFDGDRCFLNGKWVKLQKVKENFQVRGMGKVEREFTWTDYGPVIYRKGDRGIVLRWVGWDFGHLVKAVYLLNTAGNWEEFRRALSFWSVPSQNVVYADVEGNIGYQLSGLIPKRSWSGVFPVERGDWEGFYSTEELPSAYNPREGIIVTANQRIKPDFAGVADACMGYRAERIKELLQKPEKIDKNWVVRVQSDVKSLYACRFLRAALPLVEGRVDPQDLEELRGWDCRVKSSSHAALLYELWVVEAQKMAFFPGDSELSKLYISGGDGKEFSLFTLKSREALVRMLEGKNHAALEMVSRGKYRDWAELLVGALDRALRTSRGKTWGDYHYLDLSHPLGRVPLLRFLFSRKLYLGKIPFDGDKETVVQAAFNPLRLGPVTVIPSMREIIDFHDDRWIYYEGQSGIPSPHYADLLPLYLSYRYIGFSTPPFQILRLKP